MRKPKGYWDIKENCIAEARKYDKRTKFLKGSQYAYLKATEHGWLDECCAHMHYGSGRDHTLEGCMSYALQCKNKAEWARLDEPSYRAAIRNDWLEQCTAHMDIKPQKPKGYWTEERVIAEGRKYDCPADFQYGSSGAWSKAVDEGWLDEAQAHMTFKHNMNWTKELCVQDAQQHATTSAWREAGGGGYDKAYKEGWLDDCCAHMTVTRPGYWTLERLLEDASHYLTRGAWKENSESAYQTAYAKGLLEECCQHMERGVSGYNPEKSGTLYIAEHKLEHGKIRINVGITNRTFEKRYTEEDKKTVLRVHTIKGSGVKIQNLERELHGQLSGKLDKRGLGLVSKVGSRECFKADFDEVVELALELAA